MSELPWRGGLRLGALLLPVAGEPVLLAAGDDARRHPGCQLPLLPGWVCPRHGVVAAAGPPPGAAPVLEPGATLDVDGFPPLAELPLEFAAGAWRLSPELPDDRDGARLLAEALIALGRGGLGRLRTPASESPALLLGRPEGLLMVLLHPPERRRAAASPGVAADPAALARARRLIEALDSGATPMATAPREPGAVDLLARLETGAAAARTRKKPPAASVGRERRPSRRQRR